MIKLVKTKLVRRKERADIKEFGNWVYLLGESTSRTRGHDELEVRMKAGSVEQRGGKKRNTMDEETNDNQYEHDLAPPMKDI